MGRLEAVGVLGLAAMTFAAGWSFGSGAVYDAVLAASAAVVWGACVWCIRSLLRQGEWP